MAQSSVETLNDRQRNQGSSWSLEGGQGTRTEKIGLLSCNEMEELYAEQCI